MDPIANRKAQVKTARRILELYDQSDERGDFTLDQLNEIADEAAALAELVKALAEWEIKR